MPESAEVKLTAEYLSKVLEGQVITDFQFVSGQYENNDPIGFDEFYDSLPLIVSEVKCKGKMIYMNCASEDKNFYIMHSLRLTGSWREKEDSCSRWYILLDTGTKLWFRDPRCMATLHFTQDEKVLQATLDKLGYDILTEEFTLKRWKDIVNRHKSKNITALMMDQSHISGCGNYIKAESLYYAGISPLRKAGDLSENEVEKLYEALRIIPRLAYNNKGYSGGEYTDKKGKKGFEEFHLKIYGKPDAKKTKTPDGRITHWNPEIQK